MREDNLYKAPDANLIESREGKGLGFFTTSLKKKTNIYIMTIGVY